MTRTAMTVLPTNRVQWTIVVVATLNLVAELLAVTVHFAADTASAVCLAVSVACDLAYLWAKVHER